MLVLNRFVVDDDQVEAFTARAHAALAALAAAPGYQDGKLVRALDEPRHWCLVTSWESVGTYRRALGRFEVRIDATPLLAESLDEPSAYEILAAAEPNGPVTTSGSDRADRPWR